MMQLPCLAASRGPSPGVRFDLQIIQGLLQVKTPQGAACAVRRVSLGFKQIGARLACISGMARDICNSAAADALRRYPSSA
jgi:hypothetical protein